MAPDSEQQQDTRSQEEIAAAIEKARSEARQADANARLADAQAKEAELRADRSEKDARKADLDLAEKEWAHEEREREHARRILYDDEKARIDHERHRADAERSLREHAIKAASDYEARRLPFFEPVGQPTVQRAIATLNEWDRLDPACRIEVVLTCPGGIVVDGLALFGRLRELSRAGHHVTTIALGWAASMASVLLQAGDTRVMVEQSWQMIHKPATFTGGSLDDIQDTADRLARFADQMVGIYCERSTCTAEYIAAQWTRRDWWLSAQESLELRLVDEIR